MRFMTRDGRFGFLVRHLHGKFFTFQLIFEGGVLFGDDQPFIIGSALTQFGNPRSLDGFDRVSDLSAAQLLEVLREDELLFDVSIVNSSESLDECEAHLFRCEEGVVIAASSPVGEVPTVLRSTVVPADDYFEAVRSMEEWWRQKNC